MKKIPTQDARQGRKGTPVLVVLLCSLLLALIFWVGLEASSRIASKDDNQVPNVSMPIETPSSAQ